MEYYEPDSTWEVFGITNREEFVNQYVVEGRFHKIVPEDIVKAFKTVTYLMAHSYYHYPMYDEAMNKALIVMEMAVKLKAKQLEIPLKMTPNKNGVEYDVKLGKLIDKICLIEHLSFLKQDFDRARDIRNSRVHPEEYTLSGFLGYTDKNAMLFINLINLLFLPENEMQSLITKQEQLEKQLEKFKNNLFVVEFNDTKILIDTIHKFKFLKNLNHKLLILFVNPIRIDAFETITNKTYGDPLLLKLKDFEIDSLNINGVDLENNPIKIYKNIKPENLEKALYYYNELSKVSERDLYIFISSNSNKSLWEMEKIIYENCWD